MRINKVSSLILLSSVIVSPCSVFGEDITRDRNPIEGRIETNWRYGTDRSILMTEFWVPVAQNTIDGSIIYGDLRMMGDDQDNREFNIGAGYREMVNTALAGQGIIGGHIWYDRRLTERGSKFNQITAGMEWFSDVWDAKINAYYPLNDSKNHYQANPNGSGAGFVGSQVVVNTDQTVVEEALSGLDLELGYKIPFLDNFTDSTRIYGGGYHFMGDEAKDVSGWRARVVSDITSDIQIGARFQHDNVRGSHGFLEATVRFPFGNKQSYKSEGLYARLDESPERDIDIVSNEAVVDEGLNKVLLNAQSGGMQNVIHVNNTNLGVEDGTIDNPYNTLAEAEAAAGINDIIYVHRGDGTSLGQADGVEIDDFGQMIVGSGADFEYNKSRFRTSNGNDINGSASAMVKADPSGGPVITNSAGNGITITADNALISGVEINNVSGRGIYAENVDNIGLTDLSLNGNAQSGIFISADGTGQTVNNLYINNITASQNRVSVNYEGADIQLYVRDGAVMQSPYVANVIGNNTLPGRKDTFVLDIVDGGFVYNPVVKNITSAGTGYYDTVSIGSYENIYNTGVPATIENLTIDNISTNNTTWEAVYIYMSNGRIINTDISNITAKDSRWGALYIYNDGGSVMDGLAISNISVSGTTQHNGIYISTNDGGIIENATLSDTEISDTLLAGVEISTFDYGPGYDSAMIDIELNNIKVSNSLTGSGLSIYSDDTNGSDIKIKVENSTFINNAEYGFYLQNDDPSNTINVDLGGGAFGSAGHNQIYGNGLDAIYIKNYGSSLDAKNNWWGTSAGVLPSSFTLPDGSTVNSSPFLREKP